MSGISVGGPTPAAVNVSNPAESSGSRAMAEARAAAVSAVRERRDDNEARPVAYGAKGSVVSQETNTRYDTRGRVREEREDERGRRVDREA